MDSDALYESDGDSVCESDNAEYSEPSWSSLLDLLGDGRSRDDQKYPSAKSRILQPRSRQIDHPYKDAYDLFVPHGRASHERASDWRVSHGRVSHVRVSLRRVPHGRASHGRV